MFQRFRYFCSLVTFFRRKHVRALDAQQLFSLNFYFAVYCSCSHRRRKCSCFKLIKISGLLADLMRVRSYGTPLVAQTAKHLPTMRETRIRTLGREDPLEKKMATHSSTLAWNIPWMEDPGRLQFMGSQRVGHD